MFLNLKLSTETNKNWHAVYVASRQEKNIYRVLQEKGIEAYVPIVKTMRQWSDRKKMVEFPLLNGYVFVRVDSSQNESVLQTKGVVNFVRIEGRVARVREHEIERLKQLVELGYQIEAGPIDRHFTKGEKIKITSGPLKNLEGFVFNQKEGRFIEVALESIGQSLKVKLPEEILENV